MLPHPLLQPAIPPSFLAPYVAPTGIPAWTVRCVRLSWTLWVSLPLQLVNVVTSFLFDKPILPAHPGRDFKSNVIVTFVQTLVWSATWGYLPPGEEPVLNEGAQASTGPKSSMYLYGREHEGVTVRAEGVKIDPVAAEWCRGIVKDGFRGRVKTKRVGGSWLWRDGKGIDGHPKGSEKARKDEKIVFYFVGGGYISGDPLVGPFVFNLLRSTPPGTRVFGLSYRLAQQPSTSFPAALQDALAAWSYLTHDQGFAPENITLAGDSAGGGLIWSLITYLGVLQTEERGPALGMPGQVAMFSPWLDLTLSHPSFQYNAPYDMLNRGQCITAASFYCRNLDAPGPIPPPGAAAYGETLTRAGQLLERESFDRLGAAHPIFSPSALALFGAESKRTADVIADESAARVETSALWTGSSPLMSEASTPTEYHSTSASTPPTSVSPSPISIAPSSVLPASSAANSLPAALLLLLPPLRRTRFLVHSGSAELFASEIALLCSSLRGAGVPVEEQIEVGMAHGGAQCMLMAEGPEGGKLLGGGKTARKVGRTFGAWMAGGGTRSGGGEGWVWGD